ncbi:MAG TPA: transglycosylase domain-containing protein [Candidatus Sulfotelmatobacter sp.]|nr:transglycosylase domain-containing protein [Candidatus Sulfotelmatobacter sp.]
MSFPNLLAHLSSTCKRTARQSLDLFARVFHRHPPLRPALSAAGSAPEVIQPASTVRPGRKSPRFAKWFRVSLVVGLVLAGLAFEKRTSMLQSWLFSRWAARLTYTLEPGPSPRIAFPQGGPFDQRLGYTRIPDFARRLEAYGYRVTAQMRFSAAAERLVTWGFQPPYREPALAGLVIKDQDGVPLYDNTLGHGLLRNPDDVPPLLVNTLLFIENRRLQAPGGSRQNPVVDWARFAKAALLYAGRKLGLPVRAEGGSTLATQLEKFQHSRGGLTASPLEKLRQMTSATLKVYREGADTRTERQEILLQYLNKMPLAAAPGWGEVNGLGDGLVAWFGMDPAEIFGALEGPAPDADRARAYKHVLALLCAARGPTLYLVRNRAALEARVAFYTTMLQQAGVIDEEFARRVRAMPLGFLGKKAKPPARLILQRKAILHLRARLGALLGEPNPYTLDRLHLTADSTLDVGLQEDVARLFDKLRDPNFLAEHGLIGKRLLGGGDPRDVVYSFLLLERTPLGNLVRAHTDTLDTPFDFNAGMKMELGSTAKLRTLAHYLELMTGLYGELSNLPPETITERGDAAQDPLTRWAAQTLESHPGLGLEAFLQQALERKYSANPGEMFFTGGGAQTFANYDPEENGRNYSIRDGLIQSVNLVYVRLMRDIVRFHAARLPYDAQSVLSDPDDPARHRLLGEIAEGEGEGVLAKAYHEYHSLPPGEAEARLLGRRAQDARHLAMLFFAWRRGAGEEALAAWLASHGATASPDEVGRLAKAYGNPALTLGDFGFLLGRHPLEVWCAGEVLKTPGISWQALVSQSAGPRRAAAGWLLAPSARRAQDIRLRIRIEQDAFARMTPSWRRLGFPFERLVPSLATAIGSSSDRPEALADLMGIILNDGVRLPRVEMRELQFAADTPYETVFGRGQEAGERVLPAVVARLLRPVLAGVVTEGTARRAAGAFVDDHGAIIPVGGKTGSGDNRFKTFARGGGVIAARPVSRTAAFAFYLGDRHFGVLTASVSGKAAGDFVFTSSLPVALLRLLAPTLETRLHLAPPPAG